MKLWNLTLRMTDDSLWYIPVRWDRYDWNECSIQSIRVKCDFHKLCFYKYFINIVHCSILLRNDNCIHVNVPYTAYPRYYITFQRVPPRIITVEEFREHPRILFSNILACRHDVLNADKVYIFSLQNFTVVKQELSWMLFRKFFNDTWSCLKGSTNLDVVFYDTRILSIA